MKNIERKSRKKDYRRYSGSDVCGCLCECQLIKDHESVTNLWFGLSSTQSWGSCNMLQMRWCERVEVEKGYRNYHACYKLPCSTSLLNWRRKCCVIFKLLMLHLLERSFCFDALWRHAREFSLSLACSQVVSVLPRKCNFMREWSRRIYGVSLWKCLHIYDNDQVKRNVGIFSAHAKCAINVCVII